MRRTLGILVFSLFFVVFGATSLSASCTASQSCQVPWISSISCSGTSVCSSGADWVECDGTRTYCPTPAPCSGSCFSSIQCYEICGEGGVEPISYLCDRSAHCCRCYY